MSCILKGVQDSCPASLKGVQDSCSASLKEFKIVVLHPLMEFYEFGFRLKRLKSVYMLLEGIIFRDIKDQTRCIHIPDTQGVSLF